MTCPTCNDHMKLVSDAGPGGDRWYVCSGCQKIWSSHQEEGMDSPTPLVSAAIAARERAGERSQN